MNAPSMPSQRLRLDELLVRRGLFATRSRARDAVLRGTVQVDGTPQSKPGVAVSAQARLELNDPAAAYVSRAALKLIAGLERFGLDPAGRVVLDLGASTGGFTQVLLERGAAKVFAIDVGHGQLADALRGEPRVAVREGLNARSLGSADLGGETPDAVVSDLSFISLRLALPPALDLAEQGAWGLFLVKPQFEVGRAAIGKGGLVRDASAADAAARSVGAWLGKRDGWRVLALEASPIAGGDGNREFLLAARKDR